MTFSQKKLRATLQLASGQFEGGGNTATVEGLRMSAQIQVVGGVEQSLMNLAIWGLPLSLMNQMSMVGNQLNKMYENNMISLEAGDDETGMTLVFAGRILKAYVDAQAMPQVSFRIQATPGGYWAVKPATPLSIPGSADTAGMMKDIAGQMGLSFENAGVTAKLSNMLSIADAANRLAKTDRAKAHFLLKGAGIDDATANAVIKYGAAFDAYLKSLEKTAPSNKAIEAAQKLQEAWYTLQQQATSLMNTIFEQLAPVFGDLIKKMDEWIQKNHDWITSGIVNAVRQFAEFLAGVNWPAIGEGLKNFATGAGEVVTAVGGLTHATEILFGLWLGSKFLAVLANVRLLATAGGGAAAAGGGLMALFARLLPFLAMLTLSGDRAKGSPGDLTNWRTADPNSPAFAGYWDEVARSKGWDRSGAGKIHRGRGRDRGEIEREKSLDAFTTGSINVEGRPINKSNPMPVTISGEANSGSGWGWLGKVGSAIGGFFSGLSSGGGGGDDDSPGGKIGAMAGGGGPGKGAASVPDIPGMTADEKNTLGLILKYESRGRNVMNYMGRNQNIDPANTPRRATTRC